MANSSEDASTTAVFVLVPIAAPILHSIDPVKVAKFLKDRERYEFEILSKQADAPTLKMGKFDTIAEGVEDAEYLTDEHIKTYIKLLVKKSDGEAIDPAAIDRALSELSMPMHIYSADARVTTFCADFFERMESIGCGDFRSVNPKKTVRLLMARLQPPALKHKLRRRTEFDPSLEADVKVFIRVLIREAGNCKTYGTEKSDKPSKTSVERSKGKGKTTTKDRSSPARTSNSTNKTPVCMWPKHKEKGIRYYLKDCRECPKEEKDRLFDEIRKSMAEGARDTAMPLGIEDTSVLFSAFFAEKVRTVVSADSGANDNILDSHTVQKLRNTGVELSVQALPRPRIFDMAAFLADGKTAKIECTKSVVVDVELYIRHGTALVLCRVRWLATHQTLGDPLLGRPLLEALGSNTRNILAAAAEKHLWYTTWPLWQRRSRVATPVVRS